MTERLNGYLMDEWANQSAPRSKERDAPEPAADPSCVADAAGPASRPSPHDADTP